MKTYMHDTIEVAVGFMFVSGCCLAATACWYYIFKLIYGMYCLVYGYSS